MPNFLTRVFGSANERTLKRLWPIVHDINDLEAKLQDLPAEAFPEKTAEFRADLADEKVTLDDILPEAFAYVREAARRTIGLRHFDVQLLGGIVLHQGKIAEMKTGEGKTLVATLPLYLNALEGKGAHLVTVNDYLARRDVQWMGPVFHYLGLSVASIIHDRSFLFDPAFIPKDYRYLHLRDVERRAAYRADITYGTNNEFGFDYLRDNMKFSLDEYVQRELHYAIVDEVDNILIDEARTPLIISGPAEESTDKYYVVDRIIPRLRKDTDYTIDEKHRSATLTEEGIAKCERLLGVSNLYDPSQIDMLHHVTQALKAHTLFKRDVDYVVKDGEVLIVDEFTGRLMPGRRWSDGLHQAVEAKEGVKIERENQTLATITIQNYFRMYAKLAGMTGTADTEAVEFKKIYKLDVVVMPPNKPMRRVDHPDVVYKSEREKFAAVVEEIKECHANGQPVLVGTTSVEKSERVSKLLKKDGVKHNVLNAINHEAEANIIAQAGRHTQVTIATNMAGRGTDILLGGNPEFLARSETENEWIRRAGSFEGGSKAERYEAALRGVARGLGGGRRPHRRGRTRARRAALRVRAGPLRDGAGAPRQGQRRERRRQRRARGAARRVPRRGGRLRRGGTPARGEAGAVRGGAARRRAALRGGPRQVRRCGRGDPRAAPAGPAGVRGALQGDPREVQADLRRGAGAGGRCRRPPHPRHRTARGAPDRQPAARPRRPAGRPRLVAFLPLAGGRPAAHLRRRPHAEHDGTARDGGGRADRAPPDHARHPQRAGEGRGAQLRHPQAPPRVRRRPQQAARGHLHAPAPPPLARRAEGRRARAGRGHRRRPDRRPRRRRHGLRGVGLEGDRRRGLRAVQLPLEPARGGACRPPHRRAPGTPRRAHSQGLRPARDDLLRAHHAPPGKAHHAPDARRALEGPPPQHGSPEGGHRAARLRTGEPPPGLPEGGVRHVRGNDPAHGSGRDREADERAAADRGGGCAAGAAGGGHGGRAGSAPCRARGDAAPAAPDGARDAGARRPGGAGADRDRAARRGEGGAERSLPVRQREEVQEVPRARLMPRAAGPGLPARGAGRGCSRAA